MSKNKSIPFSVIMLGIVSLLTDASTEMIYPLIPIFVAALGSGPVILGVIEGVAETTASILKLLVGIISDKISKRKLFVFCGYSLSSIVRPFTALVTAAWQIIFIRMLDRVGKGIRTSPRDAMIADLVNESIRGKAYGFHRAMDHTGAVIGPLLSIAILVFLFQLTPIKNPILALRWVFGLAIIPGMLAMITIISFVKEPSTKEIKNGPFSLSLKKFDRNFIIYLLILILFTLGNSSDAFLLFRIEETIKESGSLIKIVNHIPIFASVIVNYGSPDMQKRIINILLLPLVWSYFHIIKALFSTPLSALSDRIGRKKIIAIGWMVYAFVYFSFAMLNKFPQNIQVISIFVLFGIYALYYAFTEGTEKALVADMVREDLRGSAFGIYNFSIGLGMLPASIIFGILYSSFGGTVAFAFGGGLAFTSIILLMAFVKESKFKNQI